MRLDDLDRFTVGGDEMPIGRGLARGTGRDQPGCSDHDRLICHGCGGVGGMGGQKKATAMLSDGFQQFQDTPDMAEIQMGYCGVVER